MPPHKTAPMGEAGTLWTTLITSDVSMEEEGTWLVCNDGEDDVSWSEVMPPHKTAPMGEAGTLWTTLEISKSISAFGETGSSNSWPTNSDLVVSLTASQQGRQTHSKTFFSSILLDGSSTFSWHLISVALNFPKILNTLENTQPSLPQN